MKKILILLVSVVVILTIIVLLKQEKLETKVLASPKVHQIENVSSLSGQPVQENLSSEDVLSLKEEPVIEQFPEMSDSQTCVERVNEQYPELEKQFDSVMSEAYMNGDMAAGSSPYQRMSMVSLKALADSNDVNAMMVYGTDQMWFATIGLMINERPEAPLLTSEQKNDIVEQHQVDMDKINEGEEYLFRAAVFGKVAALYEFPMLAHMAARKLNNSGADEALTKNLLARAEAYTMLSYEIQKQDAELQSFFSEALKSTESLSYKMFENRMDSDAIKMEINEKAGVYYEELYARWVSQREYYGFDIYPDIITGSLNMYLQKLQTCRDL